MVGLTQCNSLVLILMRLTRALDSFWARQLVCGIKTKKILKYLSVHNLRIGTTHTRYMESKKISNDKKLIQSDPTSFPINQKGNN